MDARAHLRIGLEHMVSFAWVVRNPSDSARPRRIARHGFAHSETRVAELQQVGVELIGDEHDPALALDADATIEPLPSVRELCAELDEIWLPRLGRRLVDLTGWFSYWYAYLYRGASSFVHPSSDGIKPLYVATGDAFVVRPAREMPALLEIVANLGRLQIAIACFATPWLVDEQLLEDL